MGDAIANTATVVVSLFALLIAGTSAYRQLKLMHGANILPVILEGFEKSRSDQFRTSRRYIKDRLSQEHEPHVGISGLPDEARRHVQEVGGFLDDLGKFVAHGAVDEALVIGSYGSVIREMWRAIAAYAYSERKIHGYNTLIYFENLAARTHNGLRRAFTVPSA